MLLYETKMSPRWMAEKFATLNGTKNFTTVPTRERLRILPLAKHIQSITSTINQQMNLYNFHLKHFKTLKTTPTCSRFSLFL